MWIRPESLPFASDYRGMISRGSETNRQYWIWGVIGTSDIGGRIGNTNAAPGGAGVTMQEDNWYNIVITGDPIGDIVMYFNGGEVARVSYGTQPTTETTSLYMGYMDTFDYFPGSIDEVRVSNIERNLSWINTSYRNQRSSDTFLNISAEESFTVSCKVKNIGSYDGEEVVQLYVRNVESLLPMPIKQLRSFKRIELKKKQEKTVVFNLNAAEDMRYYDTGLKKYKVKPGKYEVQIGASSSDIRLKDVVEVNDTKAG